MIKIEIGIVKYSYYNWYFKCDGGINKEFEM